MNTYVRHRALGLVILLSFAAYLLAFFWFPLRAHYDQIPALDVRSFTPSLRMGFAYAAYLLLLYGLYLFSWAHVRRFGASLALIVGVALLFALPLLFTYPINATDAFRYFIRARVLTVHAASPFAVPPATFPADPFLPLAGEWAGRTTPYGPLWELVAAAITIVSSQNLLTALILFKALGLVSLVGSAVLIWWISRDVGTKERAATTLLWAWNPALLHTFVTNAHNDALMLSWLLLAFYLLFRRNRYILGVVAGTLAALTKPIALLPMAIFILGYWRSLPSWRRRLSALVSAALPSGALALLLFLPFGSPLELATRLVTEAAESPGFSTTTLAYLMALRAGIPLDSDALVAVATALFLIAVLWLLWRTWRGRSTLFGAADIVGAYLLTAFSFRIWYAVWPFPWLLLSRQDGWRRNTGLWFLLTAQLSVVIYGHVRALLLQGDQFVAHLIGVPFTFLLPLLLALVGPDSPRSHTRQTKTPDY